MSKKKRAKMTRERQRSVSKPRKSDVLESTKIQRAMDTLTSKNERIGKAITKLTETKQKGEEKLIELAMRLEEVKKEEANPTAAVTESAA